MMTTLLITTSETPFGVVREFPVTVFHCFFFALAHITFFHLNVSVLFVMKIKPSGEETMFFLLAIKEVEVQRY